MQKFAYFVFNIYESHTKWVYIEPKQTNIFSRIKYEVKIKIYKLSVLFKRERYTIYINCATPFAQRKKT